ncbi:NAD(P)/FAD-dependent oxidoreductase [Roseospira navarrensis]|uniref:FAD-dependent oxidoreductase n=1 Tax=Roseospira navarrensis TaxID=140058 RepID=A0A7X1ZD43_9PROT|nr:FAD-dependent oxidoreductase [Roseospira navarrensis]MQX36132.1 FAD-dependent oxidoreductase [Roseospira navarrensis]
MTETATETADILILGAGMAGASVGYALAGRGVSVLLLEREDQPGYHSTGRSAALFSETYGPPLVRRLSAASRAFLDAPPDGFTEVPLLTPRGLLAMGLPGQDEAIDALVDEACAGGGPGTMEHLDAAALLEAVPILRPGVFTSGALEPGARDMDVDALHTGFLKGLRRMGGRVLAGAEAAALSHAGGVWRVATRGGAVCEAPVVVNAAGAWADEVAGLAGVRPLGLTPKRRTALLVDAPAGASVAGWPMTGDLDDTVYFKPDAGRLLLSPADATPVPPQDVQPELEDVAVAVDRFQRITTHTVERPRATWAGLRSFVPDGVPVAGFAPEPDAGGASGFFWLAGQGGYGIQTAVGLARAAAALALGEALPDDVAAKGVTAAALAPERPTLSVPNPEAPR